MSLLHPRASARRVSILAAAGSLLLLSPPAVAHDDDHVDDGVMDSAEETHGHHEQHGGDEGHLPAGSENVRLVGKGTVGHLAEGRVADVGVHKGYAYLTAFNAPRCKQGGVYVMDIQDPTAPTQVSFVNTSKGSYAGEGSQTISIDTPQFTGDVLAFNNEICDDTAKQANGGMTLVDVTDPTEPQKLVSHAGDLGADGKANEIHSVFLWDAGDKAYAVLVDNEESADVDIMDISDPRNPVLVAEHDLAAMFPQILQEGVGLDAVFLHDMVVKEIDDRFVMLLSYWDGGYVTLDVTDPVNPTLLGDSDFAFPDPEAAEHGLDVDPEGNAHQAEFTLDNDHIIAADEDFSPYKSKALNATDGTTMTVTDGSDTPALPTGETFEWTTVFTGLACNGGAAVPAATGPGQIAVVERGVCAFTEKVANVEAAGGYEAVLVFNREGADGCSELVTMLVEGGVPAMFVGRQVGYGLFDVAYDEEACRAGDGTAQAPIEIGTTGDSVRFESVFDGWGYVHLYDNNAGKLTELDTYAIPEGMDEAHADGSGDLSVHEVAVSEQQADLAYLSYYAGGLRVVRIVGGELQEVGHFIDEEGNNFWGVQVFEMDGTEYVAASDRDSGVYIFEYTGP